MMSVTVKRVYEAVSAATDGSVSGRRTIATRTGYGWIDGSQPDYLARGDSRVGRPGFPARSTGQVGRYVCRSAVNPPNVLELKHKLRQSGVTLGEILDHRLVVETGVVELAAQRADAAADPRLQALIDQMHQGSDRFREYRRLDTEFHILIARSTQSQRLTSVVGGHSRRAFRFAGHDSP